MNNTQANEAGTKADELINSLSTPSDIVVEPEQVVEEVAVAQPDPGNWEVRFKSYKQSTDITIHELRQQVQDIGPLKQKIDLLEKENEELKTKLPPEINPLKELFSEEETNAVDQYIEKKVGSLQKDVTNLKQEEEARLKAVEKNAKINAHNAVVRAVKSAVPEYDKIDANPAFVDYMNEPDQFGNVRRDLLITAKEMSPPDVGRVIQFYVDFMAIHKIEPEKVYTQQELLQTPSSQSSNKVEEQATPMNIRWDQATISQFYKDRATGKISVKEAANLERDMYRTLNGG